MIALVALFLGKGLAKTIFHYIEFATYDGFNLEGAVFILVFIGFGYEFKGAEHVAVVGDGEGRHSVLDGLFVEALDGCGSVEEGELGMRMEM